MRRNLYTTTKPRSRLLDWTSLARRYSFLQGPRDEDIVSGEGVIRRRTCKHPNWFDKMNWSSIRNPMDYNYSKVCFGYDSWPTSNQLGEFTLYVHRPWRYSIARMGRVDNWNSTFLYSIYEKSKNLNVAVGGNFRERATSGDGECYLVETCH